MTTLGLTPAATLVLAALCITTAAAFGIAATLIGRINRLEKRHATLVEWAWAIEDERDPNPPDTQPMGEILATEISRPVPYVRGGGRHAKR